MHFSNALSLYNLSAWNFCQAAMRCGRNCGYDGLHRWLHTCFCIQRANADPLSHHLKLLDLVHAQFTHRLSKHGQHVLSSSRCTSTKAAVAHFERRSRRAPRRSPCWRPAWRTCASRRPRCALVGCWSTGRAAPAARRLRAGRQSSPMLTERLLWPKPWRAGVPCPRRCRDLSGATQTRLRLHLCSGCSTARYCSPACQKAAWRACHRCTCRRLQARTWQARPKGHGTASEARGDGVSCRKICGVVKGSNGVPRDRRALPRRMHARALHMMSDCLPCIKSRPCVHASDQELSSLSRGQGGAPLVYALSVVGFLHMQRHLDLVVA